jgi:hypothetical protein
MTGQFDELDNQVDRYPRGTTDFQGTAFHETSAHLMNGAGMARAFCGAAPNLRTAHSCNKIGRHWR